MLSASFVPPIRENPWGSCCMAVTLQAWGLSRNYNINKYKIVFFLQIQSISGPLKETYKIEAVLHEAYLTMPVVCYQV